MASSAPDTERLSGDGGKTAAVEPKSSPPRGGAASYFRGDFFLRLFLFAATLSALIVLVTSKQTKLVRVPSVPILVPFIAKFKNSPALIYLLASLAVTCVYSILTLFVSTITVVKSCASPKLLFFLLVSDVLILGVMASATGTAGGVAYVGLKGDSHVRWNKVCGTFDKYCRHVGGAVLVSLGASIALVALVLLSSFSLYRRCA